MENWGLTYYKEQFLILDENSHPREIFDSMRISANVIGHQFFGMFEVVKLITKLTSWMFQAMW